MNRNFAIAAAAFVASAAAFQSADTASRTPIFGSTTRLVQVNVVVLDKSGKPVADLRKEDFELFEDGRPQRVAVFVPEEAKPVARPVLAPNEFSNQFTATNASRSGYSLILLDWLNSGIGVRITSQQQVLRLLKQIEMQDLVSLCVLDQGLRVLHDFTGDRAELVRRISATYVALKDSSPDNYVGLSDADTLDLSPSDLALSGMKRFLGTRRVLDTLSAFEQVADYLGSVPGRKSLIWVTSGFPSAMGFDSNRDLGDIAAWERANRTDRRTFSPEMNRALRRLNDADIAVYPVDARGLLAGSGGMINVAAMKEIASRTGGRAYYNRNDIDNAMRSALDDSHISYTLGYYPTGGADGKYRNIRVKALRPGVTLRYRGGYEAEGGNKREIAPQDALQRVLGSPLDATLLPVSAHAEKADGKLAVRLRIDVPALTLREEGGRRKGTVSVIFAFRPEDSSGKLRAESQSNPLDLTQEAYERLLQQGLFFRKQVVIPPKATSLRIVVRDEESARMGSVTIQLSSIR